MTRIGIGRALRLIAPLIVAMTLMPKPANAFSVILRAFRIEKALYEVGYELNNRPEWVRIPLTGILRVIE